MQKDKTNRLCFRGPRVIFGVSYGVPDIKHNTITGAAEYHGPLVAEVCAATVPRTEEGRRALGLLLYGFEAEAGALRVHVSQAQAICHTARGGEILLGPAVYDEFSKSMSLGLCPVLRALCRVRAPCNATDCCCRVSWRQYGHHVAASSCL